MDENPICAICLYQIVDKKMLPCKHIFCVQCLVDYVTFANKNMAKKRCPLCSKGFQEIGKDYEAVDVSSHETHIGYVDLYLELDLVYNSSDDEMGDVSDASSNASDVMWFDGLRNDEPPRTLENEQENTDQPPHILGQSQVEANVPISEICNNELIADEPLHPTINAEEEDSENEEDDVIDADNYTYFEGSHYSMEILETESESDVSSPETLDEDELENEDSESKDMHLM